jgi:hypothetical protein
MEQHTSSSRRFIRPFLAHKSLTVAVLVFVILALGLYTLYRIFFYTPPAKINFQEYEPGYLPAGLQMQGKHLEQWVRKPPHPSPTELNFGLNKYNSVSEMKNDGTIRAPFNYSCKDNEDSSCAIATTKNGQKYRTSIDKMSDTDYETIEWLKGDTLILFFYNAPPGKPLSSDEVGKFIDSFKPVSYRGLTLKVNNEIPPNN